MHLLNFTVYTASILFVFWRQICNCVRKDYELQHAGNHRLLYFNK